MAMSSRASRNVGPRELSLPLGQALGRAEASLRGLRDLTSRRIVPAGEAGLARKLEGLVILPIGGSPLSSCDWLVSGDVSDGLLQQVRQRSQAYVGLFETVRSNAGTPSVAWLSSIHRLIHTVLPAHRPSGTFPVKARGIDCGSSNLLALDALLGAMGESHPLLWLAEVAQALERTAIYRTFGDQVSALATATLLDRATGIGVPVFPLFHRILQERVLPSGDRYAHHAEGATASWSQYFLELLADSAAASRACEVAQLGQFSADHRKLLESRETTRLTFQLHARLLTEPVICSSWAKDDLQVSKPSINRAILTLLELGIVREVTGKLRDRYYRYEQLLEPYVAAIAGKLT